MANAKDHDPLTSGGGATNATNDDDDDGRYTQKSIALQRTTSITSTHSQSSISASARRTTTTNGNGSSGRSIAFPASPALSALSKNTSSSGSSSLNSAAQRNMSVDDILSSNKLSLSARQKRMRMQFKQAEHNKALAVKNKQQGVQSSFSTTSAAAFSTTRGAASIASNSTHKPQHHHVSSSKYMARALASLKKQQLQPSAKRKLQNDSNPQLNAGVEERKKRHLAQLQQQQQQQQQTLQRRNQKEIKGMKRKQHLLERNKLEQESKEVDVDGGDNSIGGRSESELKRPPETIGSVNASFAASRNNDYKAAAVDDTVERGEKEEESSTQRKKSSPPRRSKRVKTVASLYNGSPQQQQQQATAEEEEDTSSSPVAEVITNGDAKVDGGDSVTQSKGRVLMQHQQQQEAEEEEDEPESAELALAALFQKYNACIIHNNNNNNNDGTGKTTLGERAITPWNVVNSFQSVLQHVNLYDPDCKTTDEYQTVEKGLVGVLKSVGVVKREVMNRNKNSITTAALPATKKGGNDKKGKGRDEEEEELAQKEAGLLQLIQIQSWIRMIVWNFEGKVGWEFLQEVIALADAKDEVEHGTASAASGGKGRGGKKKKVKKKKSKKSKKEEQSQSKPLSITLVNEVQALAELAPYVLPPSMDFAQWLKDTLTFGFRHAIPDYGTELFDHFEIEMGEPIALKRSGTDQSHLSHRSERSQVSHSPVREGTSGSSGGVTGSPTKQELIERRQKRQQAYFASLAEEIKVSNNSVAADDESATITGSVSTVTSTSRASSSTNREKDDTVLFKTSVSLTSTVPSRTQNPFLKGSARANYVGSHLSSKLSNITSLFREVKAPAKPKPVVAARKEKKKIEPALPKKVNTSASAKDVQPVAVAAAASQQRRQPANSKAKRLLSSTPAKETGRKRLRPAETPSFSRSAAASSCVEETPRVSSFARARAASSCVEETPRQIIEETPAKRTRFRTDRPIIMRDSLDIVAETPQPPQQLKRGGGRAVLPTNLWRAPDQWQAGASSRQSFNLTNNHQRRGQHQQGRNSNSSGGEHLTPVNNTLGIGAPGGLPPLNFGLSPMPHQEDMVSVMAQAAKAAADRKKKA